MLIQRLYILYGVETVLQLKALLRANDRRLPKHVRLLRHCRGLHRQQQSQDWLDNSGQWLLFWIPLLKLLIIKALILTLLVWYTQAFSR
jgi:hypothetical protein